MQGSKMYQENALQDLEGEVSTSNPDKMAYAESIQSGYSTATPCSDQNWRISRSIPLTYRAVQQYRT